MHIDDLVLRIRRLPIAKRVKLAEIVLSLEETQASAGPRPVEAVPAALRPLRGLLRDLGPAPSGDEVDEARRELWTGFPREHLP